MIDVPDRRPPGYAQFVARWASTVMALLLRVLRDPLLAYDVTAETLAIARLDWNQAPEGDEALAWLIEIGVRVIEAAAQRGIVPSAERRRGGQTSMRPLGVCDQREIIALSEAVIELPASASEAAAALARAAPPPSLLADLRSSDLVEAVPMPNPGEVHRER